MELISKGNHTAFRQLFDRHGAKVLGYALQLLGEQARAEDLAQEVWMKVIRQAPSYRGQGQFIAWIKTMTRNGAFNELRRQKRLQGFADEGEHSLNALPSRQDMEQEILELAEIEQVRTELNNLPEMQRFALVAWLTEDLSYEELASHLGVTVPAVKSLLFRARQYLTSALRPEGL